MFYNKLKIYISKTEKAVCLEMVLSSEFARYSRKMYGKKYWNWLRVYLEMRIWEIDLYISEINTFLTHSWICRIHCFRNKTNNCLYSWIFEWFVETIKMIIFIWESNASLTLSRVRRIHWLTTNPVTSTRAISKSWTGFVFPCTAPMATRADAAQSSASITLHEEHK